MNLKLGLHFLMMKFIRFKFCWFNSKYNPGIPLFCRRSWQIFFHHSSHRTTLS